MDRKLNLEQKRNGDIRLEILDRKVQNDGQFVEVKNYFILKKGGDHLEQQIVEKFANDYDNEVMVNRKIALNPQLALKQARSEQELRQLRQQMRKQEQHQKQLQVQAAQKMIEQQPEQKKQQPEQQIIPAKLRREY